MLSRSILTWTQRALLAGGMALFAYCAVVFTGANIFERHEERRLDGVLTARRGANIPAAMPASVAPPAISAGVIGRIEIESAGVSALVMEGDDSLTLQRAVGHIPGTALPGQTGNAGIAGHRDTYFRSLRYVKKNDIITIATPLADYRYRVVSIRIVSPTEVSVLNSGASESLTLVTCYPFYYIGPAPDRYIVRAERIASELQESHGG